MRSPTGSPSASRGSLPEPYYADDWVTLYHGDCRELWPEADVIITDPPYGIAYRGGISGKYKVVNIAGDASSAVRDEVLQAWGLRPALVFGSWKVVRPPGVIHVLTWEKGDHVGMGDLSVPWRPNTEEIYVLGSGFIGHRGSSVLRYNAPSPNFTPPDRRFHPTEKPLELMRALIGKCPAEWVVLDPFAGSGSTLVAAKSLGRRAVGVEIEERYCEVAARRLSQEVLGLVL